MNNTKTRTTLDTSKDVMEITPKQVYMIIPEDWVCTYHQLINYLADAGKSIIDDCSFSCKGNGKTLFNCWALFQSACSAYQEEDYERAEFFHTYVKQQLKVYYNGTGKEPYNGGNYYPITPDGRLKALCSCNTKGVRFTVDLETGRLYQEYLNDNANNEEFSITENGDLKVESDNKV